jgi:site-specific recombinase XerD
MTKWTFHHIRHHFCTSLLRGGATLETVRVLAGHGNVKVTNMYVHTTSDELTKAIERL